MAKAGPGRGNKKEVEPKEVERLAKAGYRFEKIAEEIDIGKSTFYQKAAEKPEVLEAYKRGRQFFHEWVKMNRAEQVLSAFDRLIQEGNPAAVIFGMKAIVGLTEQMNITHSVATESANNEERLAELERKRQSLIASEIDADFTKDDAPGT